MSVVRLHNPGLGLGKFGFLLVTSISASMVGKTAPITALAPGGSGRLVVVVTLQDGKQLVTAGAGKGKVLLDSFVFTPSLATIDKRGKVSLPADPRITDGKVPNIHIVTVGHPGRGGSEGTGNPNGFSGTDGLAGADGRPGNGGAAGAITVSVDPAAQPVEGVLILSNRSGSGQQGSSPTFAIGPVPPL
jgi:hypothetical protein